LATTVYDVEEVELQDGSVLKLKPLAISKLKRFMAVMNKTQEATTEDKALEILIEAAAIVIESQYPELAKDKEKLEEVLDVPTINRIIKICGGIDLEDPNLIAAAVLAGTN
jgi:hypothetical protein